MPGTYSAWKRRSTSLRLVHDLEFPMAIAHAQEYLQLYPAKRTEFPVESPELIIGH